MDIKPNESYNKKNNKTVVFTSLKEWAMLILEPSPWNQLDQAIEADPETQERWNRCKQKLKNGYKFRSVRRIVLTKRKKRHKTMESQFSLDWTTATNQSMNFTLSSTKGYSMDKEWRTN